MKRIMLFIAFMILTLSGCKGGAFSPDCAADGLNCKQFKPEQGRPVTAADCAADGPGCKQFNPNKP